MWIIVTGASSGIGAASAVRLAERGRHDLLLVARRIDVLRAVAASCASLTTRKVEILTTDLSAGGGRERFRSWLEANSGVSALINSASGGQFDPLPEISEATYNRIMDTNVGGLLFTTKLIVSAMCRDVVAGTIVNISSDADCTGFHAASIYCASKGAVRLISKALGV
jgi:short-subunit dehydrogenase